MCSCGCNTCETKIRGPLLTEGKVKSLLSEGLQYHIDKQIPLFETVYRIGSEKHLSLIKEARKMYSRGIIDLCEDDEHLIKTHLGEFGMLYEIEIGDKVKASKEYGGLSGEVVDIKGSFVVVKTKEGNQSYHESDLIALNKEGESVPLDLPMLEEDEVTEAEFKGKDVPLNKPKRGGSKKFYVYVKNPKTKRVKKVSFGAAGGGQSLKVKIRDSKARKAFAARHRCSSKKDRTSSGYWSCNLPRYAQALGLGANMNTFW
jgi:hypothetical protein